MVEYGSEHTDPTTGLSVPEKIFIESWTDEEWDAIFEHFVRDVPIREAISFIVNRRTGKDLP